MFVYELSGWGFESCCSHLVHFFVGKYQNRGLIDIDFFTVWWKLHSWKLGKLCSSHCGSYNVILSPVMHIIMPKRVRLYIDNPDLIEFQKMVDWYKWILCDYKHH